MHNPCNLFLKLEYQDEANHSIKHPSNVPLVGLITSDEMRSLTKEIMSNYRHILAWNNFTNIEDKVERIAFPLSLGDEYD